MKVYRVREYGIFHFYFVLHFLEAFVKTGDWLDLFLRSIVDKFYKSKVNCTACSN